MERQRIQFRYAFLGALFMFVAADGLAQNRILPDPTRPPVVVSEGTDESANPQNSSRARLMAVFIQSKGRSAVINNDTVFEGQTWNGMQVLAIHPKKVVLKNESGTQELLLNDVIIKRDAQNEF